MRGAAGSIGTMSEHGAVEQGFKIVISSPCGQFEDTDPIFVLSQEDSLEETFGTTSGVVLTVWTSGPCAFSQLRCGQPQRGVVRLPRMPTPRVGERV
ncbi:UNVERIFIED_CONTAM: hypothetical protein Sradi_2148000 [Sesamum radiatum]|uniref:Uncharacterized protein n=1 Tax=Sesamum radiatum TaxID=300843 RepID=A0AAW2TKG2_SESRA